MFIADTRTNCYGNSGGQLHDEWDNYSYTSTCVVGKREKRGEIGCEGRALACVRAGLVANEQLVKDNCRALER